MEWCRRGLGTPHEDQATIGVFSRSRLILLLLNVRTLFWSTDRGLCCVHARQMKCASSEGKSWALGHTTCNSGWAFRILFVLINDDV